MLRACQRCGLIYRDGAEFCGVDGAPTVETDSDPLVGRRVGQYDVLAREDVGGVAVIYRARHAVVGHEVALKVLLGEMASRPAVAERFRREAHAACRIVHPNVVRTFDFGTSDSGVVYLTMELLRGVTLSARLGTAGLFSPQETRRLTVQIAEGLAAIHGLGYVHRDIKPGNIMLVGGPAGLTAKIIDFGLVGVQGAEDAADRLTRQGTVLGTPQYMAPEIIHGDPPSPAIDLYGLGATLYEMLSGKPPFEGTLTQILLAHVQTPPKPLPGTGDLGALALALLAKEPEDRPASAEVVTARLLSPPRPPRRGVKVAAAVGVAALALVAAAAAAPLLRSPEPALAPVRAPRPAPEPEAALEPEPELVPPPARAPALEAPTPTPTRRAGARRDRRPRPKPAPAPQPDLPAILEVRIESEPPGARVSTPQGVLGLTPLSAFLPTAEATALVLEKEGHAPRTVRWTPDRGTTVGVTLRSDAP